MRATTKSFGRRNLPALPQAQTHSAVPLSRLPSDSPELADTEKHEAIERFKATLAEGWQAGQQESSNGRQTVPKSIRAALLAGLVVALLLASLDLGGVLALGQQFGPISLGGYPIPIVPLLLLGSLWSGARSSALGLLVVHGILSRMERSHIGDYAFCGALVSCLYALILQALGWGDLTTLSQDIATGLAAGFFYRLFAGTKSA